MRAVVITHDGGPDVLQVRDVPAPVRQDGEVLIDVAAAGLNRADVQQRRGLYPPPQGASKYLGLEVSGRIADPGTSSFSPGQEVVALLAGGGYAEQVAVPAGQVLPVPDGVAMVDAASLPEVSATVYSNLVMAANLGAGDTVLIHGGAGGIGTFAIQLATALGALPLATVGSASKADLVRSLGAQAINYREEDFVERVRKLTNDSGADVILDVVGAKYLERNVQALANGGQLVIIGLQGGATAELNLGALMGKRASVLGTTLRSRPVEGKSAIMAAVRENVWPLVESGQVKTQVDRTFDLAEVAQAHEYFDSGSHTGKVLLKIRSSGG